MKVRSLFLSLSLIVPIGVAPVRAETPNITQTNTASKCWHQRTLGRMIWSCAKAAASQVGSAILLDEAVEQIKTKPDKTQKKPPNRR
jgi:hypothetical protein